MVLEFKFGPVELRSSCRQIGKYALIYRKRKTWLTFFGLQCRYYGTKFRAADCVKNSRCVHVLVCAHRRRELQTGLTRGARKGYCKWYFPKVHFRSSRSTSPSACLNAKHTRLAFVFCMLAFTCIRRIVLVSLLLRSGPLSSFSPNRCALPRRLQQLVIPIAYIVNRNLDVCACVLE